METAVTPAQTAPGRTPAASSVFTGPPGSAGPPGEQRPPGPASTEPGPPGPTTPQVESRTTDRALATSASVRQVTTTTGVHRLAFIDGLRGLAAVYVVISHVWDTVFTRRPPSVQSLREFTAFLGFGRFAVTLFIVVSGFSIGLGAWRGGLRWPRGTRNYVTRRFTRIWPPYAAAVLLSSLLAATVLSHDDGTLFDSVNNIRLSGVVDHLLLLQDVHWAGPAGSSAFWSIAVEFHIYFAFLVVLIIVRWRNSAWIPAVIVCMLITAVAVGDPHNPFLHWLGGLSPSLYALFIIGFWAAGSAVVGVPFSSGRWRWSMIGMMGLGVMLIVVLRRHFVPLSPLMDFIIGPAAALLITGLVVGRYGKVQRMLSHRRVVWLGDCSYSIYLIHAVVIEIVWRVVVVPITTDVLARLVLELFFGVVASVATARLFYIAIERRFLRPGSRERGGPAPMGAPAEVATDTV